eukprot:10815554-Prorocentrum_lima.AAC.1
MSSTIVHHRNRYPQHCGNLNIQRIVGFAVPAYVTSHDSDDCESEEFYLPSYMAHWHPKCPHKLQEYEHVVFTIKKHKVSAVLKR